MKNAYISSEIWDRAFLLGVEYGVKMSELGNNKQAAVIQAKEMLDRTKPQPQERG